MNFLDITAKIHGNVVPVPAQFNDDLSLNVGGMQEHVSFLLDQGVKVFYLALSASQFEYMTSKERLQVVRGVCNVVGSKGTVLAQPVTNGWIDGQIEEAKAMMDAGADVLVVKPVGIKEGGKFFSCTYKRGKYSPERHDDFFISYMERMAIETQAPLAYHDAPFKGGQGLSLDALLKIAEIDNTVCVKVHVPEPSSMQKVYGALKGKVAAYDGFGKTLQLWSLTWGATGRHTCWSWFDPQGDMEFTKLVMTGDIAGAVEQVNREWPIAHAIIETGFQGYMELMSLAGLPSGPIRIPGESLSSAQKGMLKKAAQQVGII
ncbi:dihydrodipicolinate synthase family protein [Desulfovibrio mangrovi]|uniref:dihydrodipicolinate synthase family protein n=1 Tax=Desulfovibrio mangrovi TaxID=2976983 RepID=UPI0022451865|nr:dihydrodipicolinate synthase family protein [Desulfovibrio mangrovi]UZP66661.1 dihydrodipicolinate synthase family protein [Desulfovibrio mangrovi]